jgi:hypothetical protein
VRNQYSSLISVSLCGLLTSWALLPLASAVEPLDPKAALTPEVAAQLSQNVNRPVIVIMKNQLSGADAGSDQAPVVSELNQVKATRVKAYRMVNALAATVSDDEVARLKANPAVAEVVPDVTIHRRTSLAQSTAAGAAAGSKISTSLPLNVIPGACAPFGQVQLDPEGLQTTNTDSTVPGAKTARSLGITGAGVKVAWIADGVDPNNVNFIRPDGKSAFFDYQDFSGDGLAVATDGDEAFLDSNAIVGQGIHVYNVNGFSAQPDPGACNIRIEGVAPGASVLGLKVFGNNEYAVNSNFIEAIEYAVQVDHVDVINESFGNSYFPDLAADAIKLFNDAAVAAGVTVTVSTGDGGSTNSIGTPATDPNVIAVGASTTFRAYAQTNYAAARYFASTGWLNDNISSLSSGGFNESGRTVDLVAPGDIAFASCDASTFFAGCVNFQENSSDIEESGGTSLSSPLTAGAAALVIEAYRKTHSGASPSPALVKQILTSTATDLGTPASEQGAGLLNSYRAVLLAESINTNRWGFSTTAGQTLLFSQTQLNAVGAPGSSQSWPVTVTNTGGSAQSVQAAGRTFGPSYAVQSGSVTLTDGKSPEFDNYGGLQNNYGVFHFNVPGGVDRLDAAIAYPASPANYPNDLNARVRLILIDPQGRLAAHSLPQGVGNFGNVDVREPVAGTWTGVIFGDVLADEGTNGTVPWQVSVQQFVPFGSVWPASFFLAPGQSQTLWVSASTPPSPGDASGSIVLSSEGDGFDNYVGVEHNSIPVTLRSLIEPANGGAFQGVLTGGNGRPPGEGQTNFYEFNIGPGHSSITANVSLTNDAGDPVGAYLINPDGATVGFGQNSLNGTSTLALTAYTLNPVPGTWTLIVEFAEPVVGNEVAQPFSGNIKLDAVSASAPGLPNSGHARLHAGVPVTIPVVIRNNGAAPEGFFIDARLNATASLSLVSAFGLPNGYEYPLPLDAYFPLWLVPTETSSFTATATASLPIVFDLGTYSGDPDLFGAPTTPGHAAVSYAPAGGVVTQGLWNALPDEIGPYPASGAPAGTVSMSMVVTTKAFDDAVTSAPGDLWLQSISLAAAAVTPVIINPGQTVSIPVTITPSGAPGTIVSGTLYVDDVVSAVPPDGTLAGDELAALPYSYTID